MQLLVGSCPSHFRLVPLHSVLMRHYDKLDSAIDEQRLARGLSWKQLADAAGVSDVTLRNIRKGRSEPNSLNKRRLEDALQWEAGSIDAVLDGGNPTRSIDAARARAEAFAADVGDSDDMVLISREALEVIQQALRKIGTAAGSTEQILNRELGQQRRGEAREPHEQHRTAG